ncbi:MAG TPA: DUF4190 domain-containing protein [Thermoguttaceae bacterium]|nr:DUF4190 domain-containing protein [Thermoguttaceae bacterium]
MTSKELPDPSPTQPQSHYRGKAWIARQGEATRAAYRRIEPLAVASLVLGLLAWLPMFGWPMLPVPVAGGILGYLALRRIENSFGEKTGRGIAIGGLVLSIVLGLIGTAFFGLVVARGVPIGYAWLTFEDMQPNEELGEVVPQKALDLQDKFIFVKGYMYPGRRTMGIQQFVLVPSQWHCKFCQRDLKSTEMITVTMTGDELADYTTHMVGIGGKLTIDHNEALRPLGGMPYKIEADVFRK